MANVALLINSMLLEVTKGSPRFQTHLHLHSQQKPSVQMQDLQFYVYCMIFQAKAKIIEHLSNTFFLYPQALSISHPPTIYNPRHQRPWILSANLWLHVPQVWRQQALIAISFEQFQSFKVLCDCLIPCVLKKEQQVGFQLDPNCRIAFFGI